MEGSNWSSKSCKANWIMNIVQEFYQTLWNNLGIWLKIKKKGFDWSKCNSWGAEIKFHEGKERCIRIQVFNVFSKPLCRDQMVTSKVQWFSSVFQISRICTCWYFFLSRWYMLGSAVGTLRCHVFLPFIYLTYFCLSFTENNEFDEPDVVLPGKSNNSGN